MENLEIAKFNSSVSELTILADKSKDLKIASINDKGGYELVHRSRIELRDKRNDIKKEGKLLREYATNYRNAVIKEEKELIAIIEPVENYLKEIQSEIDDEKEKEKRKALLPSRLEKLATIEYELTDGSDFLLDMSPEQFTAFFNDEKVRWIEKKEAILAKKQEEADAKQREIDAENQRKADDIKRQSDLIKIKKEAEKKAKREAKEKIEQDERDRVAKEAKDKAELESKKKYQAFLKKHGADIADNDFITQKAGNTIILYKKVGTFNICSK